MGKKPKKSSESLPDAAKRRGPRAVTAFPSTRLSVLQAAEGGDWERFFGEYLVACTKETAIACRVRGIPVHDVEDLVQDLVVRLQRSGSFAKQWREQLQSMAHDPDFRGNIPAKYLHAKRHLLATAKFRTYLKAVIKRVVLEHLRRRDVRHRELGDVEAAMNDALEESVDASIDRNLVVACLERAARILATESLEAPTKGKRRLFGALFHTTVERLSQEELAIRFGVDRTTAARLLKAARQRFVRLLEEATGIDDRNYLRRALTKDPDALVDALKRAEFIVKRP